MFDNNTNELITVEELCELLMVGKNTAYHLLNSREIEAFRIGNHWKIPRISVQKYILEKTGFDTK